MATEPSSLDGLGLYCGSESNNSCSVGKTYCGTESVMCLFAASSIIPTDRALLKELANVRKGRKSFAAVSGNGSCDVNVEVSASNVDVSVCEELGQRSSYVPSVAAPSPVPPSPSSCKFERCNVIIREYFRRKVLS